MLSIGLVDLPLHDFVYELQSKMYLIVTSFVLLSKFSPAQSVDKVTLPGCYVNTSAERF